MNKTELFKAVNKVMQQAKGVAKNSTVGFGKSAYKGVNDMDVKELLQPLMAENGLSIFPVDYETNSKLETWEEAGKMKSKHFIEVKATYLLCHSSGETIEIKGMGQGIDSGDKAPGKALTYALKNALLYTFLIPAGLDDTDNDHSDDLPQAAKPTAATANKKPWLNRYKQMKDGNNWVDTEVSTDEWLQAVKAVKDGKRTLEQVFNHYNIKSEIKKEFIEACS